MIPMPETYQPYADGRRVDFGFSFGVVAVDAAELARPSSSAQYLESQIEQTHDGIEEASGKYTTLEHNMWVLDGTMELYPDDLQDVQTGWISEAISGEDGVYTDDVHLTFDFSEPQDSYGLTFVFDERLSDNLPAEMKIIFYDSSGGVLLEKIGTPTVFYYWIDAPVQGYSSVRIDFLSTKIPGRRIRVLEVIFGIITEYNRRTIVNASDQQSIDLLSESLPSAQVTVKIDNQDRRYNLLNPQSIYAYLQSGQYINYWYVIGGQRIDAGIRYFYTAESDDDGMTASITFNDRLIFLEDIIFNGGASGTWDLQEAVTAILTAASIDTTPVFDDSLGAVVIRKCIPQDTDCREALRLCAQAAMCVCYIDKNDAPHFSRPVLKDIPDEQLTRHRIKNDPKVVIGDRYNAVTIRRTDSYTEGAEEETYTLSVAEKGDIVLTKEISNDLVNDMAAWAEWALPWIQRRISLDIDYRGNPALEIGDTVQVFDSFGVNGMSLIESHDLSFNGGLSGAIKARR